MRKRIGVGLIAVALICSAGIGPAAAADLSTGHFDILATPTCDSFGYLTGLSAASDLGANDRIEVDLSTPNPDLEVGFEVEDVLGCNPVDIHFTLDTVSIANGGTTVDIDNGTIEATAPSTVTDDGPYITDDHGDPIYVFGATGTYELNFEVSDGANLVAAGTHRLEFVVVP